MGPDLAGKRVLVLGAEGETGAKVAAALGGAGAAVAVVAARADSQSAFAVQRLARRLAGGGHRIISQAIDATNEMAVRVMVRQVSKALGGLEAVVFCADLGPQTQAALSLALRFGDRQLARGGGGRFVVVGAQPQAAARTSPGVELRTVAQQGEAGGDVAAQVLAAVAAADDNR